MHRRAPTCNTEAYGARETFNCEIHGRRPFSNCPPSKSYVQHLHPRGEGYLEIAQTELKMAMSREHFDKLHGEVCEVIPLVEMKSISY